MREMRKRAAPAMCLRRMFPHSASESILFYSRPDDSVGQIIEPNSDVQFILTIRAAEATFAKKPKPLRFEVAVSDIDHRIFTTGTLPLYNKTWETARD
jgi:hypothetical protein